jgi:hypothetical protein
MQLLMVLSPQIADEQHAIYSTPAGKRYFWVFRAIFNLHPQPTQSVYDFVKQNPIGHSYRGS